MPVELSSPEAYSRFIASHAVTMIHFWGAWNAYDRLMQKRLKEIELLYEGRIGFGSVDVDQEEMMRICIDVGLKNVPALAYYKRGERIEIVIGLEQEVEERLNVLLEAESLK